MLFVAGIVAPVFGLILLGWIGGRLRLVPGEDPVASLNGFVIWFALPALLFQAVAEAKPADLAHPAFLAAFGGGVLITFATGLLLARAEPLTDRSLQALAASYSNTAYIGIPICTAAFGPLGLSAAVLASLVTISALVGIAILLIEIDRHRARSLGASIAAVATAVLRNPLVAAPLIGLCWRLTGLALPGPLDRLAGLLAGAASPAALVTIGLFFATRREPAPRAPLARLVLLKMAMQPIVTAALAWAFGLSRPWAGAAILLAALPTGSGPFMLAELYERDRRVTAGGILVGTLVAVVTTSALLLMFGAD